MSTGVHNFALPGLKWAHKSTRTELSNPSSPNESDDPNQEPTQQEQLINVVVVEVDESSGKPWDLRSGMPVSAQQPPPHQTNEATNLDGGVERNERREKKKEKLRISLTKEEIEEDLYSLTGSMPSQRPRKRTRAVQKLVDKVFPGLSLDGTSADTYRVQHFP
ncbi:hypothetical protein POM88_036512 [Heracleum sosnowskyi]|uniref:Uncharacterized protein n=1 Tax=Heracleum sosnowskyi TaxID=360622 RepID=A0AAD8HQS7_9APIA|nr:hypothetical protein POM88_036512 [Heracleum sosnowskyi]